MKPAFPTRKLIALIIFLSLVAFALNAQEGEQYFHHLDEKPESLVITVLHPSIWTVRALVGLQEEGFFPKENIIIVGSYHEDQVTDYDVSKKFVQENQLEWFRFHEIRGSINKDNLYQRNACTADFTTIFTYSDGIIFFGGADIPPEVYGDKTNLLTGIRTPFRHFMELSFVFHLLGGSQDEGARPLLNDHPEFPVLGICLGEQTINVGTGGTLIQDIWFEKYGKIYVEDVLELGREKWHNNPLPKLYPLEGLLRYNMHRIRLKKSGKFVAEMHFDTMDTPTIISSHHQAADELGKGIRVTATSLDGKIVEAIEHDTFPNVLGTQFHPEFPELYDEDGKYKITLEDGDGYSLRSVLESNPPSYDFHKNIWAWFIGKVQAYHDHQN